MLTNFKSQLNSLFDSQVINSHICGVLANVTGLKQHSDLAFNPYILAVALVEMFLGSGLHIGTSNSFNLESIYQSYDAAVQSFNELRKESHKGRIDPLTKDGLMYYLKKPAFEEFSKRLFEKVFVSSHNHISDLQMLREGQLLIQSLNTYLQKPITDVIAQDGCYKVVDGELHSEYKGARITKKYSVNEDGSIEKAKNAQLGIQTAFSIVNNCPTKIDISPGVASEREYVQAQKSTLDICDVGYYSVGLIDDFDASNAYIVVRGRSNLVGTLNKVVIDGVDRSADLSIGCTLELNKALLPALGILL